MRVRIARGAIIPRTHPKTPLLSEIEHLGENLQHTVGIVGRGSHGVMQLANILTGNICDFAIAELREDEFTNHPLIRLNRAGFFI